MTRRHRQHLNPLTMVAMVPREAPLILPAERQVEVELGCADARFCRERAAADPESLLVGLDIRGVFLVDARNALAETALDNVLLEEANFLVDLDRLFPSQSVARFFINFPDPWFKRRQRNRRWLTDEAVGHLVRALRPGGEIFFQSDVWDLVLEALAMLEASDALKNAREPWTFYGDSPFQARSTREVICTEDEKQIWRLLYKKV